MPSHPTHLPRLTRMRQMACHPDLVLRSKTNAGTFALEDLGEGTVCRICNDVAEDAIQSKCRHIFDRACIKQYLTTAIEETVRTTSLLSPILQNLQLTLLFPPQPACPVCHLPLTIDLEAPALELEENVRTARQGILGRLNLETWRSSSKIEALVEELSNLRMQDATTKSLVFSQFVNFLDLIAFRLQRAGFNVRHAPSSVFLLTYKYLDFNELDLSSRRNDEPPSQRRHHPTFQCV
jgi:DNA repair protein RAD16